jgi:PKD repeat protein
VRFSVQAGDPDGIAGYVWTYGDGTFGYNPSGNPTGSAARTPAKTFFLPGVYPVRVTVVDPGGNWATQTLSVTVAAGATPTVDPTATSTADPTATSTVTPTVAPGNTTPTPQSIYLPAIKDHAP